MKNIFVSIVSLIFLFTANVVFAEGISQFHSDIIINQDATVDIVEKISYDFGALERHGIYRDIPVKYYIGNGVKYTAKIDNITAKIDNKNDVPFTVSREGTLTRVKIGQPNVTITGKHTYTISYTVHDAITYFDDHQEFYWNVTGDEWPVAINKATAQVTASAIDKTACFAGAYGSSESCDSVGKPIARDMSHSTVMFAHNDLKQNEGMTIVVGMPIGTVYKPSTIEKVTKFALDNWIVILPVFVFFFMWYRWWRYGRDPKGTGVIIPYYESPDGLSPAEVGMVVDEVVHDRDVAAALIDIAVKGHMLIRKEDGDYIFIKKNKNRESLSPGEDKLFESLFEGNKEKVTLASLKNKFYLDLNNVKARIVEQMISEGYYSNKPEAVKASYVTIGAFVCVGSFFAMSIFGFIYGLAIFLSAWPIIFFGWFMPRRTKKGVLMSEKILGLKLYLETAEKDRINFHNAPEKNPQNFEKLLPYAVALGVEKQWAKQFDDIYEGRPDWYEGTDKLAASVLASEMHSLTKTSTKVFTSRPQTTSSAASGGSGFSSGGGFSGGGFGGGGGGSW